MSVSSRISRNSLGLTEEVENDGSVMFFSTDFPKVKDVSITKISINADDL